MTLPRTSDLGECGAYSTSERRCEGRLVVLGELGGLLEAQCDRCGRAAASPVGKVQPEPDRPDPWWDR